MVAVRQHAERGGSKAYQCGDDYHAGTTWAPVGHTPIVRTTGARHSVNLISAVTAQGAYITA